MCGAQVAIWEIFFRVQLYLPYGNTTVYTIYIFMLIMGPGWLKILLINYPVIPTITTIVPTLLSISLGISIHSIRETPISRWIFTYKLIQSIPDYPSFTYRLQICEQRVPLTHPIPLPPYLSYVSTYSLNAYRWYVYIHMSEWVE